VGIARALAIEPKVLLLDEPFGALDALTRATLQDELMRNRREHRCDRASMVTHDVDEAVLLSDRVVMMTNGPAATIGQVLEVDLPRPRARLALAHDPRFMELRAAVLEFLYEKAGPQAPEVRVRVVVIGNGMVGQRFLEKLASRGADFEAHRVLRGAAAGVTTGCSSRRSSRARRRTT